MNVQFLGRCTMHHAGEFGSVHGWSLLANLWLIFDTLDCGKQECADVIACSENIQNNLNNIWNTNKTLDFFPDKNEGERVFKVICLTTHQCETLVCSESPTLSDHYHPKMILC